MPVSRSSISGPFTHDNLGFKLAFWPDKHNVVARQVRQVVNAADPQAVTTDALSQGSVALQRLPAVAQVLYGEAPDPFACAFLEGLAGNIDRLAETLQEDWRDYAGEMAEVAGGDPLIVYYRAVADGLDRVRELKLERPLGSSRGGARGALAEGAKSGLSIALIEANLATIEALLLGDGSQGLIDALPDDDAASLRRTLEKRFAALGTGLEEITQPLAQAVGDEAGRWNVQVVRFALQDVERAIGTTLGPALGFQPGLNASDGD